MIEFEVFRSTATGEYRWHLLEDGEVLAFGAQGYDSEADAIRTIENLSRATIHTPMAS